MSIIHESHIRTPVNRSVLVHFTVKFEPAEVKNRAVFTHQAQRLLREAHERVNTIAAQYTNIDPHNVNVLIAHASALEDSAHFQLAAIKECRYKMQLVVESSHTAHNGTTLDSARSVFADLFGAHKALVKVLQAYKASSATRDASASSITSLQTTMGGNHETTIAHTDRLAPLLIELAQLGNAFDTEDDIIEIVDRFSTLHEVSEWLSKTLALNSEDGAVHVSPYD